MHLAVAVDAEALPERLERADHPEPDPADGDLPADRVPVAEQLLGDARTEHRDPAGGVDVGAGQVAAAVEPADENGGGGLQDALHAGEARLRAGADGLAGG